MTSKIPEYRAYCDICNYSSPWYPVVSSAKAWRDLHFEDQHPDNPMKKENCRIQRQKTDSAEKFDNPAIQIRLEESFAYQGEGSDS